MTPFSLGGNAILWRRGFRWCGQGLAGTFVLTALAHLLDVLLDLRTLLRREHVHHLLTQLLTGLRVGRAALGMGLAVLLHELLELRLLLVAQGDAVKHAHEAVAVMAAVPLTLGLRAERTGRGRLVRLLREDRHRSDQRRAQGGGKKKRTKGFHWVVLRGEGLAVRLTYGAGKFA